MRGKRAVRPAPGSLPPIGSRSTGGGRWTVGVFVYRGVSSSEIDEPVARLAARLDADIVTIAPVPGSVHGVEPSREIEVDHVVDAAPPVDVLVVPGGLGWKQVIDHEPSRAWLARTAVDAKGILAISTGSLLLASALASPVVTRPGIGSRTPTSPRSAPSSPAAARQRPTKAGSPRRRVPSPRSRSSTSSRLAPVGSSGCDRRADQRN